MQLKMSEFCFRNFSSPFPILKKWIKAMGNCATILKHSFYNMVILIV